MNISSPIEGMKPFKLILLCLALTITAYALELPQLKEYSDIQERLKPGTSVAVYLVDTKANIKKVGSVKLNSKGLLENKQLLAVASRHLSKGEKLNHAMIWNTNGKFQRAGSLGLIEAGPNAKIKLSDSSYVKWVKVGSGKKEKAILVAAMP